MRDGSGALGRMQPGIRRHPSYSSSSSITTTSSRSSYDLSILSSSDDDEDGSAFSVYTHQRRSHKPIETASEAFQPCPASCPPQRRGPTEGERCCSSCCGSFFRPLPPDGPGRGLSCRCSNSCATRLARGGWNAAVPKGGGGGAFCLPLVVRLLLLLLLFFLGSGSTTSASAAEDSRSQAPTPRITQDPQSAILAPHQDYLLRCGVTPDHAQVRWLFNGQPLNLNHHFGVRLQGWDLYFPPLTIRLPSTTSSSNSSLPSSSSSAPLAGAASSSSSSPPAQEDGAAGGYDGEYRCTATTAVGTVISRPAVISRPVLRKFPRSDDIIMQVEQGGYVTIPCTAPSSHPPANIGVMAPSGTLLLQGERVLALPSGSVVLTRLAVEDAGNYTCLAVNPVSGLNHSATHHFRLSVIPSSLGSGQERTDIVDQSVSSLQVALGDTAYLECPVAGLGLPARIAWKRDYVELPSRHTTTEFGQLIISSVELRDNGSYFCESPSGQKRQVQLQVFVPPKVTADVKSGDGDVISARVGETVRLACKGQALPAASVTWYHDGQVRSRPAPSHGRELHVLTLDPVKAADGGVYVCELANRLGHAAAVLRLDVVRHVEGGGEQGEGKKGGAVSGREPEEVAEGEERDASRNFQLQVEGGKEQGGGERNKKNRKGRKKKGKKRLGAGSKAAGKNDNPQAAPTLVLPSAPIISRVSDSSVLVEWQVPENDGEPISHFVVQYREVRPRKGEWKTHTDIIRADLRGHRVGRLKPGTTYMFRMFAVYANDDNRNGPSRRFHLKATGPHPERRPQVKPRIVEAKPIIYQNIYAINIKWQFFPTESSSVIGFNIYYRPYDSKEDFKKESLKGAVIRNHLLKDLQADTEYEIKMECFNSAGSSDYSNMVVKRTLPMEGQAPPGLPTPVIPPEEKRTEAPPGGRREAGGLEQPMILGIVLGVMLLLLVVFITMCWWKQRQQKRRSGSPQTCGKFQDQAQRIYADSLRKKHMNGGPAYPISGLNGLSQLPNGHGPPPPRGHPHLEVNPLAELDNLHHPPHRMQSPSLGSLPGPGGGGGVLGKGVLHHDHQLYSGKPYHMGNGLIPNGTLPGYGHGHSSDNNFNSIRHTVSSDDMLTSTTGNRLALPNGLTLGSLQRSAPGVGDCPAGHYGEGPIPALSRTSLSSFGHPRNHHHRHPHQHHHHHSHPHPQPPLTRGRNSSLSHSDSLDSTDSTAGELGGERAKARCGRSGRTSPPCTPPLLYSAKGIKVGGTHPPPVPHPPFHTAGRCSPGRDNGAGGPAPLLSFADERRKVGVVAGGCYGHDGLCGDAGGGPSAFLPPEEGGGAYRPWAAVGGSGPAPTSGSRPKRRRKRPHSGREREREYTATKDQATNTDLSSNGEEGAGELGKSPAGSLSTGSSSSVSVTGHLASDVTHVSTSLPPVGFHPSSGGDSDSGGSGGGMRQEVGGGRAAARLSASSTAAVRSTSPPAATGVSDLLVQEVGSALLLSADCGRLGRRKEEAEEEGGPVEGRLMTRDCGLYRAAARSAITVGPL